MILTDALFPASAFPADDEAEDVRRLADLIAALQAHAECEGYPEVAAALDPALEAAQAAANGKTAH